MVFGSNTVAVIAPDAVTSGVKQPLWLRFPERLRETRERSDLNQIEISDLASLARPATSRFEGGLHRPSVEVVERYACALGVSPTWLAFGFDGFEAWRERVPRKGEPERADPTPQPAQRDCPEAYRGIPERLRHAREQSGLSMRAIARATELSAQTIALIEAGRSVPLISNIEAIAKALTVSPGWLAFGEIDTYE